MKNEHVIDSVEPGSIAYELEIEKGDVLLSVNDTPIEDVFDYRYLIQDSNIVLLIKKSDGEEWEYEIEKDPDEDLGIVFDNGLMDEYRRCCNKCIFCFIDQMPPGMRETLYFKDDDSRLSFLQGNYITLTNMSEHDIDRIIKYRLSPINISFQTTDPELRCKMLNNRFAGQALEKVSRLYEAGITMNGQIVLCKGINDGDNLKRSFDDLLQLAPVLQSVSVVPVGLTKYRDNLFQLEPFEKEDALEVLGIIDEYRNKAYKLHGIHLFHASDEFYLLAERALPAAFEYDGYLQIENGVGMLRSMLDENREYFEKVAELISNGKIVPSKVRKSITVATGFLAYESICEAFSLYCEVFSGLEVTIIPIRNDFFGEKITVAGLVTGRDLINQLKGRIESEVLWIPSCMLKADAPIFLDDVSLEEVENALQVQVDIVKSNGLKLYETIMEEVINE